MSTDVVVVIFDDDIDDDDDGVFKVKASGTQFF